MSLSLTGQLGDKEDKVKGDIEIPNLSDENDIDEVDVSHSLLTVRSPTPHSSSLGCSDCGEEQQDRLSDNEGNGTQDGT